MKRLLNKDEMKYKKEQIKEQVKINEENTQPNVLTYFYPEQRRDKGIPGAYLKRKGGK